MVKWILLGFLALPIAEIAIFVVVAGRIGLVSTLGLTLATSLAGVLLLRWGAQRQSALFHQLAAGHRRGITAGIDVILNGFLRDGFLVIAGGFLLAAPGFITDAFAVILLLIALGRWCRRTIGGQPMPPPTSKDEVVELGASEWHEVPERGIERGPGKPGGQ
jgi:UPF0716 protein FxsA